MSALNFRSNVVGAAKYFLGGEFIDDIEEGVRVLSGKAEFHESYTGEVFSDREISALLGNAQPDGAWVCSKNSLSRISADKAKFFMIQTQECASIMVAMLDKLSKKESPHGCNSIGGSGESAARNVTTNNLVVGNRWFNRDEIIALQGQVQPNGNWLNIYGQRKFLCSKERAQYFMESTQSNASIMVGMLDKLKELGVLDQLLDEVSDDSLCSSIDLVPSLAPIPVGLTRSRNESDVACLYKCLSEGCNSIQSFFNDLQLLTSSSLGQGRAFALQDHVLHVQPFDEELYCRIILENHRLTIAELNKAKVEKEEEYAAYGMAAGAILALVTQNPLLPFIGNVYGKNMAPRSEYLSNIIPDPKLFFLRDRRSYSSMVAAGAPGARLRRLIFHPVASCDRIFLRCLPALVTADSIVPAQVFKADKSYFMRPIAAGMSEEGNSYSPNKLFRQYYHSRLDGTSEDTGHRISVVGPDIDNHRYKLYRFSSDSRELSYFYFDYQTEPAHVF
jgi:hypothetical protein